MKRLVFAVALCLVLVALSAVPVFADAGGVPNGGSLKLPLAPATWNGVTSGGGFAIINNGAGQCHNLELVVSIKGATPDFTYNVWLENGSSPIGIVGELTTNKAGNGTFTYVGSMTPGEYNLGVDVADGGADQYVTSNVYGDPIYTTFRPAP